MEVFNEVCILFVAYIVDVILNDAIPLTLKDTLGWVLMGVAFFNIVGNIILNGYMALSDTVESLK